MKTGSLSTLIVLLAVSASNAETKVELVKTNRQIKQTPKLKSSKPLYALAVVGSKQKTNVWFVIDQSKDSDKYDIAYVDINGNGDLTEPDERFPIGTNEKFELPDLKLAPKSVHTEFSVRISGSEKQPRHLISMRWNGKHRMTGGYPEDPANGYLRFSNSPKTAPIVAFNGDGPFQFQRWFSEKFTIGGSDELSLFLGQKGVGKNSFCGFAEHVLPESEVLKATLIYKDAAGAAQQMPLTLPGRC